ncbi:MAG: hypothetical protein KKE12_01965, partial [Proteobacteria bacterium]|nr:hypothetical protein [Pseudomonadota bacterium]
QQTTQIPVSSILLDEDIYPRKGIDHRRVGIFAENIRDGFTFDPIEVELIPDKAGIYRLPNSANADLRVTFRLSRGFNGLFCPIIFVNMKTPLK